jgi:ABC-2 type transport system ATP-binding protein
MIGMEGYERRMTADLPMGIRQRLALGCALVHKPRVIFLDEPTSGVDVLGRRQFWDILVRLAREDGVAILVTTHYMSEAEHCDDLALMYAGRVIAKGTPLQLRETLEADVGVPMSVVTSDPLRALKLAKANGFERAALFGKSLRVLSLQPEQDARCLRELMDAEQVQVLETQTSRATMEDVFVSTVLAQDQL